MNMKGNTILVTGGTSGIGLELARELEKLGNVVIVTGRNAEKLAKVQKENPGLKTFRSDVSEVKEIEALHAALSRDFPELNVIVNNAGTMRTILPQSSLSSVISTAIGRWRRVCSPKAHVGQALSGGH